MAYRDQEKQRACCKRHRAKKHAEKYGPNAGDQRGLHGKRPRGSKHHRWNGERITSKHGYVKVRVGVEHPLADPNGYAYEHLIVWAAAGRSLPGAHELLHHKNEDKTDNRIGNLERVERSAHCAHHIANRVRDTAGRLLTTRKSATSEAAA